MPTVNVGLRMPEELKKLLEEEAKRDNRTLSNLIVKILSDYFSKKQ